jgi:hypothetical protein
VLAEHLGGMTVDEMLGRISSAELTKWRALFDVRAAERERQQRMADKGMRPR